MILKPRCFKKVLVILPLVALPAFADSSLHNASDLRLLQAACPSNWSSIDKAIPVASTEPVAPTSITWKNTADKGDFKLFLRNFIVNSTKNNQTRENKVADPLLVASECIKRHNPVLNAYMGKDVGAQPLLKKLINIFPAIMNLLFGENG